MLQNTVIQFNENHKWCGCLGIVLDSRPDINRYLIGVPMPEQGAAYIFAERDEFEIIGPAQFIPSGDYEDE